MLPLGKLKTFSESKERQSVCGLKRIKLNIQKRKVDIVNIGLINSQPVKERLILKRKIPKQLVIQQIRNSHRNHPF